MSYVSNICITTESGEKMQEIKSVQVIANQGIVNDRYFKEDNDKDIQITLIQSENVDYYNQISGTNFLPTDFRRNVITKGISLNELVGKEILVGLYNGLFFAFLIGVITGLWFGDYLLGLIIAFAMLFNLMLAGTFGAAIPIILSYFKIDPAVAATVILTTITDILGFVIFLGLAKYLLM